MKPDGLCCFSVEKQIADTNLLSLFFPQLDTIFPFALIHPYTEKTPILLLIIFLYFFSFSVLLKPYLGTREHHFKFRPFLFLPKNSPAMKSLLLHAVPNIETDCTGFEVLEEEQILGNGERQIWLDRPQDDLLDIDEASIFCGDFPLPDFPCMSSSSSSSSNPAVVKAIGSSSSSATSSSAASWAVLRSDVEEDENKKNQNDNQNHSVDAPLTFSSSASMEINQLPNCIDGGDCMMENFGFMDLLDSNDLFDPLSLFHHEDIPLEKFQQDNKPPQEQPQQEHTEFMIQNNNGDSHEEEASDDLAMVFLEWLKTNKETVSAEDLRRVKIKKATIEFAAKRLGGGKEAMKQLLKLILEWVQTNCLQKRSMRESASNFQNPNPISNSSLNCNPIPHDQPNPSFSRSPWIRQPSYIPDPATVVPSFLPMAGYMGDPFANGAFNMNIHSYPPHSEYHMLDSDQSWPSSQFCMPSHYNSFTDNNLHPSPSHPYGFTGYGSQYPYPYVHGSGDQRLMRLGSSATKEARKKRMARQKRLSSHPRHHHHHNNQQNQMPNQSVDQHLTFGFDSCKPAAQGNTRNWVFWPSPADGAASGTPMLPVERSSMQPQNYQRQVAPDRRQGWKPERSLRFLLQKVLKQSDVGNLGRIVLPKKEAETHLPELEARDGISIAMEDIGTSRVWNMRYRFWPNNKSRMYLLENTGDFVRENELQEGDFIVIYSDIKCGKYLIRGVKVRQPGPKSETKRPRKSQRSQHASSPATTGIGSASSPIPQTVK
ncbi:B3 domain-containing transcription factor ABI3-like isoform X2 [Mangifera indica]|uniref:B3 domain-containing transcription factor ABI3-like isoform X2 n=1 Tax=Mangifera indica TaxID=29780 RepID=UPI001CF9E31C|nr:B3 domain-containing transcription factor ABI3-like isoform X2 [Mangifera indica]